MTTSVTTAKVGQSTSPVSKPAPASRLDRGQMSVVPESPVGETELDEPFDRAYAHIMAMTDEQIAATGLRLFPENHYQRIAFTCWLKGVQNAKKRHVNPRVYPPNFIGEPGLGKSGMIYEAGAIIGDWLSEVGGGPIEFKTVVRTLAGVNDLSEIIGIVHLDHETKRTIIYPRADMPVRGDRVFGWFFVDDANRGEPGVQGGMMEFVNTLGYNGYQAPYTMGVIAATNPQGKAHKVKAQDKAQMTRWVNVVYSPSRDAAFIQQLARQGVPAIYIGYCAKFKHIAKVPDSTGMLPEPREINFRNATLIGHIFGPLQHDERAWIEVASSNLGPGEMKNIQAMVLGELPLEPQEIIGINATEKKAGGAGLSPKDAWAKAKPRLKDMKAGGRTDLIAVSSHSLVRYLNDKDFNLSDDQLDVLADLWLDGLPKEAATDALRRLVLAGAPRADYYKSKFTMWNSPNGSEPGPLAKHFLKLLADMKQQLAAGMAAAS